MSQSRRDVSTPDSLSNFFILLLQFGSCSILRLALSYPSTDSTLEEHQFMQSIQAKRTRKTTRTQDMTRDLDADPPG